MRRKIGESATALIFAMHSLEDLGDSLQKDGHTKSAKKVRAHVEHVRLAGLELADILERVS